MNPDPQEWGLLLERSAGGDQNAFRTLYDSTGKQLFGVLLRILKKRAVAEEALQECFVRIWQKSGDYDASRGEPMVWMTSIARYHALDLLRRRRSREDHESAWSEIDDETVTDPDRRPIDLALADQEILTLCLDRLDEQPRECVLRAYCEGWSHEELSERLERPQGTVKSWIRRSLIALRECVDELG